ncbi:MAG: hypothetical protein HYT50_01450 [Candidatus Wildermuthbacteria bacterium]|nr:hypothetical protein [Candidatus Wildermuthbacteria bacterium]
MKETTKQNLVFASAVGAIVSIVFTVFLTIAAEFSPVLKAWLASLSGHHWVSKSIFSMVLYGAVLFAVFLVRKKTSDKALHQISYILFGTAILGVIAIFAFFAWHYLAV